MKQLKSSFALMAGFLIAVFLMSAKVDYRPIIVSTRTVAIGTAYQPNLGRYVRLDCSVGISSSLSLSGGQSGTITLQTSPDNITYTTVQTATNNNTGSLTIGLNTVQQQVSQLSATVQPGYYYKFVSTGTSTFTINPAIETQF